MKKVIPILLIAFYSHGGGGTNSLSTRTYWALRPSPKPEDQESLYDREFRIFCNKQCEIKNRIEALEQKKANFEFKDSWLLKEALEEIGSRWLRNMPVRNALCFIMYLKDNPNAAGPCNKYNLYKSVSEANLRRKTKNYIYRKIDSIYPE
jgi:hypothetical protein